MSDATSNEAIASSAPKKPNREWRDGWVALSWLIGLIMLICSWAYGSLNAAAMLIAGMGCAWLISSSGKELRRSRRIPVPGLLLLPAAAWLMISAGPVMVQSRDGRVAKTFAASGEDRLAKASAAITAGDHKSAAALLKPIDGAKDLRIKPLVLAAEALNEAKGEREKAVRDLEAQYEPQETDSTVYLLAARAIDPKLARQIEIQAFHKRAIAERDAAVNQHFSDWDGANRLIVEAVKRQMKNPGSFKHVETSKGQTPDGHIHVVMTYRGTNGFGAVVTEMVSAELDADGNLIKIGG